MVRPRANYSPVYKHVTLDSPAGITTISAPTRLASISSCPLNPVTSATDSMWDRSAATCHKIFIKQLKISKHFAPTYPGSVDDIVQRELGHGGVELQQHGQGLADTWASRRC